MKFNLNNYKFLSIKEFSTYQKRNTANGIPLNEHLPQTLPEIINELNASHILNLQPIGNNQIIAEVQIIFEDFDFSGKLKKFLNNFISKLKNEDNLENSIAHYNHITKSIHIFQKIIEPKFTNEIYKTSYETLINSISNPNFLLNFFCIT